MTHTPDILLSYLKKEHPASYRLAVEELSNLLPKRTLEDIALIPEIIEELCSLTGTTLEAVSNREKSKERSERRREFIAVLLLCYYPERLHGLSVSYTRNQFTDSISRSLSCSINNVNHYIGKVKAEFYIYRTFRERVEQLHQSILDKYAK